MKFIDDREDTNLRCVATDLYVGGMMAPRHADGRFKTVIDLYGRGWPSKMEMKEDTPTRLAEVEEALQTHVEFHAIFRVYDQAPFPPWLLDTLYEIVKERRHEGVLIHCFAGISRSVSAMYAILRVLEKMDDSQVTKAVCHPLYIPCLQPLLSALEWVEKKTP